MSEAQYSEVGICNQALSWLGQSPLVSLDQSGVTAQLCRDNYPILRDAVLESRCWTFATVRKVSNTALRTGDNSEDPEFPAWGDQYVHPIPAVYMKVFRCYREVSGSMDTQADWEREGQYILSTDKQIFMWGVRSVTNPKEFGALFSQCVAARLAADLAIPITKNAKLQAQMWALYESKISDAAVRDGQQGRSEKAQATQLQRARRR